MTFPLSLTPFEQYMLADDHPQYPSLFFIRLRFRGSLDRTAADRAIALMCDRHPLLGSVVRRNHWHRINDDELPKIEWQDSHLSDAIIDDFPSFPPIDLSQNPGLVIRGRDSQKGCDLTFAFHHSCVDGLGAFSFLNDWLVAYAVELGQSGKRVKLRPLDDKHLPLRGKFGLTKRKLLRILPKQLVGLVGVRQFLSRKPASLAQADFAPQRSSLPREYPTAKTISLSEGHTQRLRERSEQQGVTVNERLARDLFLTLAKWRSLRFNNDGESWLRLSIPMSLRTIGDRRSPAANIVSMIFLDRQSANFGTPGELLQSIHDEMQLIKRNDLGLTFVFSLKLFQKLPGGMKGQTRIDRCQATCLLTNLGEIFGRNPLPREQGKIVVSGSILDAVDTVAPIRPLMGLAISIFKYAGQLRFTFHYDTRILSGNDLDELAGYYLENLRDSAESA